MGEFTFVVEKKCPICGESSRVVKTKSRLIVEKTDEDFYVHYKSFNPYFYKIWFCEHCGFAADENHFLATISPKPKKKVKDFLDQRKLAMEFTEERGVPEAVASFKLAIYYAELMGESAAHRAGLYLNLAWIYRETGETDKEKEFMQKAADLYDKSIMSERYPIGNMTDNLAIYLVGAIYFRMGDLEKSTQYLSRIMGDQRLRNMEPKTFDRARDLWQRIREIKGEEYSKE